MSKVIKHWFKHDFYTSNNNKIVKLDYKYPIVGYGIFFKLVEQLYQNDGLIEYDLDFLSHSLNYDREIIGSVINDFGLFNVQENYITNQRVFEGIKEITSKSEKARRSAMIRHYDN